MNSISFAYILFITFLFYLPAGIANMSPVLFKWIPFLNKPIDFNKKFRGKRILGDHKTIRGFLAGIISAVISINIIYLIYPEVDLFRFKIQMNISFVGFLMGFGAMFGDAVKSFFKRQINIAPGKSWIPFDQIDWIIGANIFLYFYMEIPIVFLLTSIFLFGLLHPVINLIGYFLKIKKNKF